MEWLPAGCPGGQSSSRKSSWSRTADLISGAGGGGEILMYWEDGCEKAMHLCVSVCVCLTPWKGVLATSSPSRQLTPAEVR